MSGPIVGWRGAIMAARDSSGAPGTYHPLVDGNKGSAVRKVEQSEFSRLSVQGEQALSTLLDFDIRAEAPYHSADTGAADILAAALAGERSWLRIFDDATHYTEFSALLSELTLADDDLAGVTRLAMAFMFDGTPTTPYAVGTGTQSAAPGLAAPTAAHKSKLSLGGTSTGMTAEACSLVSGSTYQITSPTKRVLDPAVAVVVKDGGVAITISGIASVDMYTGTVVLAAPPGGAVTIDANYIPRTTLAYVAKLSTVLKFNTNDSTDNNNTNGYRKRVYGSRGLTGSATIHELPSASQVGSVTWANIVTGRTPVLYEHDLDGAGGKVLRAWVNCESSGSNNDHNAIVDSALSFRLNSRSNGIYLADFSLAAA